MRRDVNVFMTQVILRKSEPIPHKDDKSVYPKSDAQVRAVQKSYNDSSQIKYVNYLVFFFCLFSFSYTGDTTF